MKKKNVSGKLTLKKQDFAQLDNNEMSYIKAGEDAIGGISLIKSRRNNTKYRKCSGCHTCICGAF
ncbi:MAG TPA: hypothetical protein DCS93_26385 [Microscillaceae bacterium]|nr:hypothetical protein [Microscillaceae bacterium]